MIESVSKGTNYYLVLNRKNMVSSVVVALLGLIFICGRYLAADTTTQINGDFHNRYDERIAQTIETFGVHRPVILVLNGSMLFRWQDQNETVEVLSVEYHTIKSFAHASLAVLLSLHETSKSGPISPSIVTQLATQRQHIVDALTELSQSGSWSVEMILVANALGNATIVLLDRMIATQYWSRTQLREFYQTTVQTWIDRAFKLAAKVV